jgi:hypothetical protein
MYFNQKIMDLLKKLILLLITLTIGSCEFLDSEPKFVQDEYENWWVLQIPNGESAYAISGSIDEVLVVTTITKVYATNDAGESWKEVADFSGPMPGLLERNDSLFIFSAVGERDDFRFATEMTRFSIDKGYTWQEDEKSIYSDLSIPIKYVQAENNISYKIKQNYLMINGDTSNYLTTSDIEKTVDGFTETLPIPFAYILNNLHLDKEQRLYVAASYGEVQEDGKVSSGDRNAPALVFVSKNPLP